MSRPRRRRDRAVHGDAPRGPTSSSATPPGSAASCGGCRRPRATASSCPLGCDFDAFRPGRLDRTPATPVRRRPGRAPEAVRPRPRRLRPAARAPAGPAAGGHRQPERRGRRAHPRGIAARLRAARVRRRGGAAARLCREPRPDPALGLRGVRHADPGGPGLRDARLPSRAGDDPQPLRPASAAPTSARPTTPTRSPPTSPTPSPAAATRSPNASTTAPPSAPRSTGKGSPSSSGRPSPPPGSGVGDGPGRREVEGHAAFDPRPSGRVAGAEGRECNPVTVRTRPEARGHPGRIVRYLRPVSQSSLISFSTELTIRILSPTWASLVARRTPCRPRARRRGREVAPVGLGLRQRGTDAEGRPPAPRVVADGHRHARAATGPPWRASSSRASRTRWGVSPSVRPRHSRGSSTGSSSRPSRTPSTSAPSSWAWEQELFEAPSRCPGPRGQRRRRPHARHFFPSRVDRAHHRSTISRREILNLARPGPGSLPERESR